MVATCLTGLNTDMFALISGRRKGKVGRRSEKGEEERTKKETNKERGKGKGERGPKI